MGTDLVTLVKRASIDAVETANPTQVSFGKVIGVLPLLIDVEQKQKLSEGVLVLANSVKDYEVEIVLQGSTLSADGHAHGLSTCKMIIKNSLKVGDKVMLLRIQGGQKYLVLDRV